MTKILKALAILSLLGFPLVLLLYHLGLISFGQSFRLLMATAGLAAIVFMVSLLLRIIKRGDTKMVGATQLSMLLSLIPLIGLGMQAKQGKSVPPIHNISTDTVNPPQFDQVIALRGESSNPLPYNAEELAAVQQQAYPEVKTRRLNDAPQAVFDRAVAQVQANGWELVNADAQAMRIEATETTLLWRFKDDVVIRILAAEGGGSTVDMRSVSRIGRSDLGANAKRIERFMDGLASK